MTLQNPLSLKAKKAFIAATIDEIQYRKEYQLSSLSAEDKNLGMLLKRQCDLIEFRQARKDFYENCLCLYDGFKLRSYDLDYINWLKDQPQYKFKITTDSTTGMDWKYEGKYEYDKSNPLNDKGIKIVIHRVPIKESADEWAVDISGSFHNWSNKGFNYNDYYWKDFVRVYGEMIEVFQFNPKLMKLVNLEVGANLSLSPLIKLSVSELMENILSVAGVCRNKSWIEKTDRNVYKVLRGERYYKVYDKTKQNKLLEKILRLEWGSNCSRQIKKETKAEMFSDLIKISTILTCKELIKQSFNNMHLYQPELHKLVPLEEIGADRNLPAYITAAFWCKLKKSSKTYKEAKQNKERLIARYCSYNLEKTIKKILLDKLR